MTVDEALRTYERTCDRIASLRAELSRLESFRAQLRYTLANGKLPPNFTPEEPRRQPPTSIADAVRAVDMLGRVRAVAVANHLGITQEAASIRLNRAWHEGLISRPHRGLYAPLAAPPPAPTKAPPHD